VTQATLARELGVKRQAISDLIKRGVITPAADGMLDADMAKLAIAQRIRPSGKTAQAAVGALQPATIAAPPAGSSSAAPLAGAGVDIFNPAAATSYHVAKTLREAAEAKLAQMKVEEAQGNLWPRQAATKAIDTAFRALRDDLLLLGRRLAPHLHGAADVPSIQHSIDDAVSELLHAFADRLAGLTAAPAAPGEGANA
jgi:hypothetical protein